MSELELLKRQLHRERRARKQAEELIEKKSRELYHANLALTELTASLEKRVTQATADLRATNQLLTRRIRELAALNNVSTSLTSIITLDLLLDKIMDVSKEVVDAEASSLLLVDSADSTLHFQVARGSAGAALKSMTVALGRGITGHVAQSGEPALVPDAYQDPRFDRSYDEKSGFRTRSLLAVPIRIKDEIIGVLEVINKIGDASFDQHDLGLFQAFASSVAVAMENARLFERTRAMALDLREALEKERRLSIEKAKMGAYIPKHVVDEISRNREHKLALGGKTVRATVLFSDLQGFTRLAETMEPQHLISFLNVYMTAMTNVIEAQGGILDKFIGDGIMAIFIPTNERDNHAHRAVCAGLGMQRRLEELRNDWMPTRPELTQLKMRIGINTGDVVAGNIGSETRMEYTVVGDNVNVASRIESACHPDGVFISESTYHDVIDFIMATRMEPINVKNRVQPVQAYSVQSGAPVATACT